MNNVTVERLAEAAGTGEMLVIVYNGGSAPGHKRRIVVTAVDIDSGKVFALDRGKPKSFDIAKTWVVEEDNPAPWLPEKAGQYVEIEPGEYFSTWSADIKPCFYGVFGIFWRSRKKNGPKSWMIKNPIPYNFQIGDLFWMNKGADVAWIQVADITSGPAGIEIETHLPTGDTRYALMLTLDQFVEFIRTGIHPGNQFRLPRINAFKDVIIGA